MYGREGGGGGGGKLISNKLIGEFWAIFRQNQDHLNMQMT